MRECVWVCVGVCGCVWACTSICVDVHTWFVCTCECVLEGERVRVGGCLDTGSRMAPKRTAHGALCRIEKEYCLDMVTEVSSSRSKHHIVWVFFLVACALGWWTIDMWNRDDDDRLGKRPSSLCHLNSRPRNVVPVCYPPMTALSRNGPTLFCWSWPRPFLSMKFDSSFLRVLRRFHGPHSPEANPLKPM